MSTAYHKIAQPYRIQKRLALNQSFKAIQRSAGGIDRLLYITFGGQDLYDTLDLLGVFDLTQTSVRVISFEQDPDVVRLARTCPVYQTLSRVKSVDVRVVFAAFPDGAEQLRKFRTPTPCIYFLDYTGTFRKKDADTIHHLLETGLLREGDFLLITSCLSPRIVNQATFMESYKGTFELFYPGFKVDAAFRVRNHVDLLTAVAFSEFERSSSNAGKRQVISGELLKKFKYADSHVAMGLWLYRLGASTSSRRLRDEPFDEFPHAFAVQYRKDLPEIFD